MTNRYLDITKKGLEFTAGTIIDIINNLDIVELKAYKRMPVNTPLSGGDGNHVINRGHEDGEKDLVRLACELPHETAWIYLPATGDWYNDTHSHEEDFRENGDFELPVTRRNSLARDRLFFRKGDKILYHTHPGSAARHNVDQLASLNSDLNNDIARVFNGCLNHFYLRFPSATDINIYSSVQRLFRGRNKERIASPTGITNIEINDPSEETVRAYKEVNDKIIGMINSEVLRSISMMTEARCVTINLDPIMNAVNDMMKGKVILTFNPISDYYDAELERFKNGK